MSPLQISLIVFLGVYVLIIFNIIPRTISTLFGVLILMLFRVLSPKDIVTYVNWEAIGLIFGMFVMVRILKESGFFDFLSRFVLKKTRGIPVLILLFFAILAGILAMFMDSITVLLFMSTLSIEIAKELKISPIPFILSQITSANIGGSATLMGDPPNIIMGTGLNIAPLQFVRYLAPVSILILFLNIVYFALYYRKTFISIVPMDKSYIKSLVAREKVKDSRLMFSTLACFLITVTLIFIHSELDLSIGSVGVIGASCALVLSGKKMEHIWETIDWEVLIFFSTLFIIVGALVKTNVFNYLSDFFIRISSGNASFSKGIFLWFSAVFSGFIDNVPFAASMVPLIKSFTLLIKNISPLFLGLIVAFGTDIGGNFTPIGASANVVGISVLSRAGIDITWKKYIKIVVPITIFNLLIGGLLFLIFFR
jgi:Na+/H+ antiporter NhaD/arsenite permease-like protein